MNYGLHDLDLTIHRFPSRDKRHWTTPELADLADGRITEDECKRRFKERRDAGAGYVPQLALPAHVRQRFSSARLSVDNPRKRKHNGDAV